MPELAPTRILDREDDPGLSRLLQKRLRQKEYIRTGVSPVEKGIFRFVNTDMAGISFDITS